MKVPPQFSRYFELARGLYQTGPSHDFSHIERVFNLALQIGEREGADLHILGVAALFHDLARDEEAASQGRVCHAMASAERSRLILTEQGEDPAKIAAISDCIATHRFRADNQPQSIEGKCLFDADKLDSLGAIGVARAYLWLGERGGTVHMEREEWEKTNFNSNLKGEDSIQREWYIKLQYVPDKLFTETARQIAVRRNATMKNYLDILEREVHGLE
jgi:uncharacterized protein